MCGETWWDEFGDTWGERCGWWTCTVWAGGTLALTFGFLLTLVGWTFGNVGWTFIMFPIWLPIWAFLLFVCSPILLVGAVLGMFLDDLQQRCLESARARASADGAP